MEGAEPRRETELFKTLANETRLKILLAIARRQRERGPLSYAQIMDEIGMEDSGRFNYHLDQLQEHLVRREDGKYVPSASTHRLLGLLDSELLYDDTVVDPVTVGAACLRCGDPIEAIYDYDFYVSCHTCGETRLTKDTSPKIARERSLRTVAAEADQRTRAHLRSMLDGRCLACGGDIEFRMFDSDEQFYPCGLLDVICTIGCRTCSDGIAPLSVGQVVLGHPEVQRYCDKHDIDLNERPQWEYTWTRTDRSTEILSRDPWHVRKYCYVDGSRLIVELAGDGTLEYVDHLLVAP